MSRSVLAISANGLSYSCHVRIVNRPPLATPARCSSNDGEISTASPDFGSSIPNVRSLRPHSTPVK